MWSCIELCSADYDLLQRPNVQWLCCKCESNTDNRCSLSRRVKTSKWHLRRIDTDTDTDTELEATKRPINLSFKYTACVDAVSFELLKNAIIHYYQHIIQNGDIKVKINNDRHR